MEKAIKDPQRKSSWTFKRVTATLMAVAAIGMALILALEWAAVPGGN